MPNGIQVHRDGSGDAAHAATVLDLPVPGVEVILGLDPGTTETGIAVWCPDRRVVRDSRIVPNENLILMLSSLPYDKIGIEMIASYGMPVGREVFETCVWIGRFFQRFKSLGVEPKLIYRRDVKLFLCGTTRAKDANVWQAIVDAHGPVGTKKNPGPLYGVKSHARAALAVALTLEAATRE